VASKSLVIARMFLMSIAMMGGCFSAQATQIGIAAIVDESAITTTDVAARRDLVMATNGIPVTPENQARIGSRILQALIDETLQMNEAARTAISVTQEEIDKEIDAIPARETGESIRDFIRKRGLSLPSLEQQMRAQLAWAKLVQRKLRRNVNITQDEVARAQLAAANAPAEQEVLLQAIDLPAGDLAKLPAVMAQAEQLIVALQAGEKMESLLSSVGTLKPVFSAPGWVAEGQLPRPLQQALIARKPGEVVPAQRLGDTVQILQLLDRRSRPTVDDASEFVIKQITIDVPPKRDKVTLAKLSAVTASLKADPGNCMDTTLPALDLPARAEFLRLRYGAMSPQQQQLLAPLAVADISDALLSPDAVRLVLVCEKIEPAAGNLPDAAKIRQRLFAEKMELEAQKHLRNLRRDAYIDVRDAP
jgi:peptidyl-prolyl cis-trans isomerase SurA